MNTRLLSSGLAALLIGGGVNAILPQPAQAAASSAVEVSIETQPALLSTSEIAALAYLREEEKVARDLYLAFYDIYGLSIFQNIARSEQQHMDAVLNLINLYGLSDPAAGQAAGEFSNADLQALYDSLLAQGSVSVVDALKVGALVEETDILDLQEALTETSDSGIQRVFGSLLRGSYNHLASYTQTLSVYGVSYTPQLLDPASIPVSTASSSANGRGASGSRGGRGSR